MAAGKLPDMYRLIAIDLDKTLLNDSGRISDANVRALYSARKAGLTIVLATGRPLAGTQPALQQLSGIADDYLIVYNGALTIHLKTGRDLHSKPVSPDDYRDVAAFARSKGLLYYCFDRESVLTPALHPIARWEHEINQVPVRCWQADQIREGQAILKINTSGPEELLDQVERNLPNSFLNRFTIVRTQHNLLEFLHRDAGKGTALMKLADLLDLPRESVVSIGDSGNDLDMIRKAGVGVAMGNAVQTVKNAAQMITLDYDRDGVAAAVQQLISERPASG